MNPVSHFKGIKMIDFHTHTLFSHDGKADAREMIEQAIKLGIRALAVTEHCDKDIIFSNSDRNIRQLDVDGYWNALQKLKAEYADRINIAIGIECGFYPPAIPIYSEIIDRHPFDVVINSIHLIDCVDPYTGDYYTGKDKSTAYDYYFAKILQSLDSPYYYSIIAHPFYISRYAPYKDKRLRYREHAEAIDAVLNKIIEKGKSLEFNSSSKNVPFDEFFDFEFYRRYYELGGRKIIFGSDAHAPNRLAENYDRAVKELEKIGFDHWTAYFDRTETEIAF